MFLSLRNILTLALLIGAFAASGLAQAAPAATAATPTPTPRYAKPSRCDKAGKTPKPTPTPKPAPTPKGDAKITTAEQVVESAIFFYGFPGGRATLNQIRKTTLERGTASITNAEGRVEQANYQKFIIRSETLPKEKIRLDQEFPTAKYSLVFNEGKIFGIYNNSVFTPREERSQDI